MSLGLSLLDLLATARDVTVSCLLVGWFIMIWVARLERREKQKQ